MEKPIYIFESQYGPVYVEGEEAPQTGGKTPAGVTLEADFIRVNKGFEDAMGNVETMYKVMLDVLKKLSPDEFNLEVGLKFNVKTGFFILSAGSDVEFKVNLKWTLSKPGEQAASLQSG